MVRSQLENKLLADCRSEEDGGENDHQESTAIEIKPKHSRDGLVEYYNDDEIEGTNEDIIARRFCALNGSQLDRLSLDQFRHWRSTGNIDAQSTKQKAFRTVDLKLSSLVDPSIELKTKAMKWRTRLLNDKDDMKELFKALYVLDITEKYSHPLLGDGSERLQDNSVGEASTATSCVEPEHSTRSKNSRTGGSGNDRSTQSHSLIRKLLDSSLHRGRDEECEKNASDEDDQTTDELSCSTASSFSIPTLNLRRKKEAGASVTRQFLDLTDGNEDEEPPPECKRQILRRMTSWMGNISNENLVNNNDEFGFENHMSAVCEDSEGIIEDDSKSEDGEEMSAEEIAAWDKANAILIEEVHEISGRLETILNERGFESPYWNAEEVIPQFMGLHSQIKENTDRKRKGIEEPVEDTVDIPTSVSFSMNFDDLAGGYDDLGMRRIQRCDRSYLKKFFYDKKVDGTCSLPNVLVTGLEKRLPDETVEAAIDIIDELTSPIRRRRSLTTLDTIKETS
mmetsp:Transcript_28911/g.43660  ORF Transcript_28911/g.43660 Transcript_28911/m.43660 type:complete len:509 (+) Transcript_28911:200-1726(+)|eukprot:CAMPEP_0178903226 /NCGR_PEP_ID=MMETSP0786-20121207/5040_1 /TAXON_ID=186022 /ORGANISM="Thalassionema frauenfeldii, Strain CCMP 1798" /LENGTH=508 /DNA_ID=CAMNT_0020574575 /DNA_START=189 /DNA_END=1715 /DNA_ORIENTATION=-